MSNVKTITIWNDIAGIKCEQCGSPATHWAGFHAFCCQCVGGNWFTKEEAQLAHENVLIKRRIVNKYFVVAPEEEI